MIDTSASEREGGYFSEALKTVKSFANESLRGAGDRVFFEPFSLKPSMGDWLSKEQVAEQSLQLNVRGGTAIYDAIAAACIERMGKADWQKPARRVLVLISDGDDNSSHRTRDEAVSLAAADGVVIFAVSSGAWQNGRGDRTLTTIAKATGGGAFVGLTGKQMPEVFATIRALIDGMYYLSYPLPEPLKKGVHEPEIKSAPGNKFELAYPSRYFWNPQSAVSGPSVP